MVVAIPNPIRAVEHRNSHPAPSLPLVLDDNPLNIYRNVGVGLETWLLIFHPYDDRSNYTRSCGPRLLLGVA